MAGQFSWGFLSGAGDFSMELGISQYFLIRGCMVYRVRVLGDFFSGVGDFSVESGISQWSRGFLSDS